MVELITRDIPFICTVSANDLSYADRFMLEKVHKVSVDNFILVDHKKDCIFINKDLDNVSEIKELIIIKSCIQNIYLRNYWTDFKN